VKAKLGRKKVLIWIGISFLVSAVGSALASDVVSFMVKQKDLKVADLELLLKQLKSKNS